MLGIGALLDRKPRELSGGERQRVALARAIVREPAVFLLDEPLSNLDAKLRASAREELERFHRRVGTTTIYVTHDQVEAMAMGDRIMVLNKGVVHQLGTPNDVYDNPADTFVATFLGSPPMNLVETGDVIVGFRPEHFSRRPRATSTGDSVPFRFKVENTESLARSGLSLAHCSAERFGQENILAAGSRLQDLTWATPVICVSASVLRLHAKHLRFAVPERELRFVDGRRPESESSRGLSWRRRAARRGHVFPGGLYILLLVAGPFLLAIVYAFSDARIGTMEMHFVGLENFRSILQSPSFRVAIRNSLIFTICSQIVVIVGANILAISLENTFRGRGLIRFLILLPWVAPIARRHWMEMDPRFDLQRDHLGAGVAAHIYKPFSAPMWLGEPAWPSLPSFWCIAGA